MERSGEISQDTVSFELSTCLTLIIIRIWRKYRSLVKKNENIWFSFAKRNFSRFSSQKLTSVDISLGLIEQLSASVSKLYGVKIDNIIQGLSKTFCFGAQIARDFLWENGGGGIPRSHWLSKSSHGRNCITSISEIATGEIEERKYSPKP